MVLHVNIAWTIARIVVALLMLLGIFSFMPPMPQPGLAGQLAQLLFESHWGQFVGIAQIAAGILLLLNRYVPVAVIIVMAFLYNSFAYHITTMPVMAVLPIVVAALTLFVAGPYRQAFIDLFTAKPVAQ